MKNSSKQKIPAVMQRIPGMRKGADSIPAHYLVLGLDFTIVSVSDIFLKNTMTSRDNILGRNIFDVFPENPNDPTSNGVSLLRASFLRVIEQRSIDVPNLLRYDIPNRTASKDSFDIRYWRPTNFPLFDKHGNFTHIVHNSEDVTEAVVQEQRSKELELERAKLPKLSAADIFRSANSLVILHGDDAEEYAVQQVWDLRQKRDEMGASVWHEILQCVKEIRIRTANENLVN